MIPMSSTWLPAVSAREAEEWPGQAAPSAGRRKFKLQPWMIALGLVLAGCAPPPQPYALYNLSPFPQPIARLPEPPPAVPNLDTALVTPPASQPEQPQIERQPPRETRPPVGTGSTAGTALPPAETPLPAPPRGGNDDDCVGWWRVCHFF
jgi:hypothetical protein